MRRVGAHRHTAGRGGHDVAAESDQRRAEPVRVHLGGEHDGAAGSDGEPVRGSPLRARGATGPRIDLDQAERFELRGDRSSRRAGHAEFGGEHRAGGGAAGVYELQRWAEGGSAALEPCPCLGHSTYSHFVPTPNKIRIARSASGRSGTTDSALARLRVAITVFFALDGFVFAGWVVRIPAIKDQTGGLRARSRAGTARCVGRRGGHHDADRPALPALRHPSRHGRLGGAAVARRRTATADPFRAGPRSRAAGLRRRLRRAQRRHEQRSGRSDRRTAAPGDAQLPRRVQPRRHARGGARRAGRRPALRHPPSVPAGGGRAGGHRRHRSGTDRCAAAQGRRPARSGTSTPRDLGHRGGGRGGSDRPSRCGTLPAQRSSEPAAARGDGALDGACSA